MSMVVHSLASGSSGNCILVRRGRTAVLIDAGIGIKRLTAMLNGLEVSPASLAGILITHEHSDHITGALRMAHKFGIPLAANAKTLSAIPGAGSAPYRVLAPGEEGLFGELCVRAFPISHDAAQPCGYVVESSGGRVCSVTDTGVLTPRIREEAASADLLILESNHDVNMLVRGPYPWHLKRRIMGDRGHLSNDTAAELLLELAGSGSKMAVWLAHLSHVNNTPQAALSCTLGRLAECEGHNLTVEVAKRDVPSLIWQQKRAFQLSLFVPRRGSG
jgi:phosphoribosyl 1,2-cyclic phosphodiesterase